MGSDRWSLLLSGHRHWLGMKLRAQRTAMSLQLLSQMVMLALVVPSPLPETDLTLSEFRAEAGRGLEDSPGGVVISASYSKVRRQGRKGDSDPFSLNIIKTGDRDDNDG